MGLRRKNKHADKLWGIPEVLVEYDGLSREVRVTYPGQIRARLIDPNSSQEYTSINGSITINLPDKINMVSEIPTVSDEEFEEYRQNIMRS